MKKITRHNFLKILGLGTGAAALSRFLQACGLKGASLPSPAVTSATNTPFSAQQPTQNPSPSQSPTYTAQPTAGLPDLAVGCGGEPEDLVRRAVNAVGGMGRFVPNGASVVVKPNMCVAYRTYEYAATTNPWVVGALVKMAFEAGARQVKVLDYPFDGSYADAYATSGIQEQVLAAEGEMVPIQSFKFQKIDLPGAVDLTSTAVYDDVLNAEVLINVPIAKQHGSAGLTLSMKNLMGTIADRPRIHWDFSNDLTDLSFRIPSTLVVIDAVRILKWGGPQGGDLGAVQKMDTVIAGTDVVACDAWAARNLFNMDPDSLSYIYTGNQRGLGCSDLQNLNILEV
jgi:uncharacterized protein (DUF362 family)